MLTRFSPVVAGSMLAWAIGACASQHAATQVTILVDAEPHVRGRGTQLVVRVTGGHTGETFLEAGEPVVRDLPLAWPFDVTLTPAANDATRLFEVEATAYDSGHQLVSQARLRGGYVRNDARHVTLLLEDACIGLSCPAGSACRNGQCVPIGQPPGDAGVVDGGGDAGPTRCTVDRDCDDDNICNGFETCVQGACATGARVDCDDHVGCTTDSCDGHQCVHTPDDTRCNADSSGTCDTTNDCQYATCTASNCVSTGCQSATCTPTGVCLRNFACATGQSCCGTTCVPAGCDDGRACTTDFCNGTACQHDVHAGPCDDHDLCTGDGTCATDGTCTAGSRMTCDDANGCTTDSCDPVVGCVNTANATTCSDDDPCTIGDSCGGGACLSGSPNGCDDGVACTVDSCDRTRGCRHAPNDAICGTGALCNATTGCQPMGTCTTANCVPTPNTCETAVCSADGTMCLRGTTCTTGQMCCGHTCVPSLCSDGNVCTDDACNATTSTCTHAPSTPGRNCDDGNACTSPDVCLGTTCAGSAVTCEDFEECTTDSCNPSTGACEHLGLSGNPCTPSSSCSEGGSCFDGRCFAEPCRGGQTCCLGLCTPIGDCAL